MSAFHQKAIYRSIYILKKNKNILLLSSLHQDESVDENTGKAEMILDYNLTKLEVDTVDTLRATYDCVRNTIRWPIVIFYTLLNTVGINSVALYQCNNPEIPLI